MIDKMINRLVAGIIVLFILFSGQILFGQVSTGSNFYDENIILYAIGEDHSKNNILVQGKVVNDLINKSEFDVRYVHATLKLARERREKLN